MPKKWKIRRGSSVQTIEVGTDGLTAEVSGAIVPACDGSYELVGEDSDGPRPERGLWAQTGGDYNLVFRDVGGLDVWAFQLKSDYAINGNWEIISGSQSGLYSLETPWEDDWLGDAIVEQGSVEHLSPLIAISTDGRIEALTEISGGPMNTDLAPLRFHVLTDRLNGEEVVAEETDRSIISGVLENATTNRDLEIYGEEDEVLEMVSSDESIAEIAGPNLIKRVSTGIAEITISSDKGRSLKIKYAAALKGDTTAKGYRRNVVGSLARHCCDMVDSRIAGTDRDVARHIYSSFPSNSQFTRPDETRGAVDEWIRNPDFWGAGIANLPCYAAARQTSGSTLWRRAPHATMITPLHWMAVGHYHPNKGDTLAFVALDGTLVTRKVADLQQPVGLGDSMIGILDSPLPASIPPAKLFPFPELAEKVPLDQQRFIPAMATENQQHGCIVLAQDHWQLPQRYFKNFTTYGAAYNLGEPYGDFSKRLEFVDVGPDNVYGGQGIESGDSGSPAFLIVHDELVLCTVWITAGAGMSWTEQQDYIYTTIDDLSDRQPTPLPRYNLTLTDISSFPNF